MEQRTDSRPTEDQSTRDKIVAAALREFAAHGKEGARVDRIAENAGVNKAMIYYYFKSKEELHREVVATHYNRFRDRAVDILDNCHTIEEMLTGVARIHAQSVLERPDMLPLLLRELAEPDEEILDAIAKALAGSGLPQKVGAMIHSEMEAGRLRRTDIRQAMAAFIGMSLGYYLLSPIFDRIVSAGDRNEFIKARPEIVTDIFLNGLKVRWL
ncbi:MAG: TetR/AcrR family transcriptional regulator [candidate division Zixibacteria bacterium]|nr:TetR/AcrR family transcriptional regulator [candidate division Zixibacteria bacterium]